MASHEKRMTHKDYKEIEKRLTEQAALLDRAIKALGHSDFKQAGFLLKKASDGGSPEASERLALLLMKLNRPEEAAQSLITAAEQQRYDGKRGPFRKEQFMSKCREELIYFCGIDTIKACFCLDNTKKGTRSDLFIKKTAERFKQVSEAVKEKAEAGDAAACCLYGQLCHYGLAAGAMPGDAKHYLNKAVNSILPEKYYCPAYAYIGLECLNELKKNRDTNGNSPLPWLAFAASKGHAAALAELAETYFTYEIIDYPHFNWSRETALEILEKASDSGIPSAMFQTAETYIITMNDGLPFAHNRRIIKGTQYDLSCDDDCEKLEKQDLKNAFKYFVMAAKKGYRPAATAAAAMLYYGIGTEKNTAAALKIFELNAGQGDIESMVRLGDHYYYTETENTANDNSLEKSFCWHSRAADKGNAYAAMMAGIYQKKAGNSILAASYLKKAAESGSPEACYHLGLVCLDSGDIKNCLEYLKLGSVRGDISSMALYGMLLYDTGNPDNYKEAMPWLKKASAENDGMAQFYLSCIYSEGRGVKADHKTAFRYALMSADNNYVCGYYQLGCFYEQGIGTEKDYVKARKNYETAMKKSHPDAPYRLGRIYEEGLGVEPDLVQARLYYETGAACGDGSAEKALKRLDLRERK